MEWIQQFIATVNDYMQTGFYKVNALQGLFIAMAAAYMLPKWSRLFVIALGATLMHVVFDVMLPVLGRNAAFRLPPLVDVEYWRYMLAIYIGFLIIIPIFYLMKLMILRSGGGVSH